MSADGRMPARWINLYGTLPSERTPGTKGLREGTSFLGRVLLSFTMNPNEYPNLACMTSSPLKEPKTANYLLWVDLYEWINCDFTSKGENLWVEVTIGANKSDPIKAKYKKQTNSY